MMHRCFYVFALVLLALILPAISEATAIDQSIQKNFADLQQANRNAESEGQQKADRMANLYRTAFSDLQNPDVLQTLGADSLKLVYRAASLVAFYTYDNHYLSDMRLDLKEIERRHMAPDYYYADMYQTLIQDRQFDSARAFLHEHPSANPVPMPLVRGLSHANGNSSPFELVVGHDPQQLTLVAAHLDPRMQIVVVGHPLCHFTQFAGRDIEADPSLRALLRLHSIWISPQDGNLDVMDFQRWNREHPDLPMAIVWKESEWPKIDYWGTPTFYFFKNGTLVDKVVGWAKAGSVKDKDALIAGLRKVGLLGSAKIVSHI